MGDHRSIDEIEGEIRATRERLGRTVDALERKAAPAQLLTRGIEMVRSNSSDPLRFVGDAMARNPVPVALIGAGIGWLIWSAVRGETANEKARRRLDEIAAAESGIGDVAPGDISATGAGIGANGAGLGNTDIEDGIAAAPQRGNLLARHPLALGGFAALAGALVAAFLPPTRREDELLGHTRDALRDQAGTAGEDVLSRIEEVARDAAVAAVGAAFDTVREEFTPAEAAYSEPADANPA